MGEACRGRAKRGQMLDKRGDVLITVGLTTTLRKKGKENTSLPWRLQLLLNFILFLNTGYLLICMTVLIILVNIMTLWYISNHPPKFNCIITQTRFWLGLPKDARDKGAIPRNRSCSPGNDILTRWPAEKEPEEAWNAGPLSLGRSLPGWLCLRAPRGEWVTATGKENGTQVPIAAFR